MWAAQAGAYETVQRLLAKGAMRDSRDDSGASAFDMAVKAQQGDVLALLRDAS
jgi:ankyrin repeat protein